VWDCRTDQRDRTHILSGTFIRLPDCIRHSSRLPNSEANIPGIVAHNNCHAKSEASTALYNFGNAGDVNYTLIQLITIFTAFRIISSH
jgi:hypothetical protein